jgi:hypothetical protein
LQHKHMRGEGSLMLGPFKSGQAFAIQSGIKSKDKPVGSLSVNQRTEEDKKRFFMIL